MYALALPLSSLDKLAIRGIRSFDDKSMNVIQFYSPVTVIVGVNGTGKTTIIECLKYATTGELPPNTKGGAFVHDPKMAGEKEVKAQVRLRFWNVKRERMVATRNLQVSVKKAGGLTMKTLEGILSKVDGVDAGDKRNAISTKCAEMDTEVPRLMGVSTAILDNVIFCHQEESNWPLSEPAALKKKFDDIFEASKFTKALDHIKTLRKERVAALKVDAERLNFLKQDRDKADNLKKELERQRTEIGRKEAESDELTQRHEALTKANAEFYESSTKFTEIFDKAQALDAKKKMYEGNCENLKKHIKTMMKESDEDLRKIMSNFNQDKQELEAKIKEKRAELEQVEANHRGLRTRHGKEAQRLGELNANRKRYDRNANERENLIKTSATQHNISGFSGRLTREKAEDFIAILQENVSSSKEACSRIESDGKQSDGLLQEESNRLRAEQQSKKNLRDDRQRQLMDAKVQRRSAEYEVDSYSTIDMDIPRIEKEIANLGVKIETAATDFDEFRFEDKLRQLGLEIRQLEVERDTITDELKSMQKHAETRASLNAAKSNLAKAQTRIENAATTHGEKYLELTGEKLVPHLMDEPLVTAARNFETQRENASKEKAGLMNQRNRLESEVDSVTSNIEKMEMECSRTKKEISTFREETLSGFTQTEDLKQVLEEVRSSIAWCQSQLETNNPLNKQAFYEELQAKLRKNNMCIGCGREVDVDELEAVQEYISDTVNRLKKMKNAKQAKESLRSYEFTEKRLNELIPKAEEMEQRLITEIPEKRQKIKEMEAKIKMLVSDIEKAETKETAAGNKCKEIAAMRGNVPVMERDFMEVDDLERQISSLESALAKSGSTRTIQEVQELLAQLDRNIKFKNEERLKMTSERDHLHNQRLQMQNEMSSKKLALSETKNRQASRQQARTKIEELLATENSLAAEIENLDRDFSKLEQPISEVEIKLRTNQQKWSRELNEAKRELEAYSQTAANLKQISDEMRRYEDAEGDKSLEASEKAVRDLEHQIAQLDNDISDLQQEIANLRNDHASSDQRAQNIDNNIAFRTAIKQIKDLQTEIESIDLEEAARAKQQFDTKYQKAERERTELYGKLQQLVGEISQMKQQAKRMQRQLDTDYKNIHSEYIDCLVKWKTGDMANRDLEKYAKALDKSLGELWNEVYAGTDIDSIQIVSESDPTSTGVRKSYHYRLVMRKGDQLLDMRGRCSAGQKVLASILVRLALAESFAQQCGVLALDEPTTNLDVENIDALATALGDLINRMKSMKNFQLIVITHDESFLQRLAGNSNAFEYYWRVSRNAEQKSIVERQRVVAEY
ncbi:hypothetical protein NliqN6_2890 [Naganishia liquefaciens]|uniref:DNA repair protein RAD50 n=1 Tax=Naganishia liquefaciens TaxID=104408 RepID=A0A8H3TSU7_9TREE|nr:hypothetical protein NliqN6_2890 [Naganishia liquefaciens]